MSLAILYCTPKYTASRLQKRLKNVFLDAERILPYYKDYVYPGFFFNAGQTVVTTGIVKRDIFLPAFNPDRYPYYRNPAVFPLVDQSIPEYRAAIMMQRKELTISTTPYMLWSGDFFKDGANGEIESFKDGHHQHLVHYAGELRTREIERMKGTGTAGFFRAFYHNRLKQAAVKADRLQDSLAEQPVLAKLLYYKNRVYLEADKPPETIGLTGY